MFGLTTSQRFHLYPQSCDMRKGFDGLCGIVNSSMRQNALSGDVFIFINKPRNRMKLLQWQSGGFVLYYKRLEKGTFQIIETKNNEIIWSDLMMIVEGICVKNTKKRIRFNLE